MVKTNINPGGREFYFALNGEDISSGRSLEVPKRAIQAAIDAAAALIPTPSTASSAQVTAAQGGVFNESIVLADSVLFNGEGVSLRTTTPIGVDLASNLACEITTVTNVATNGVCFNIDGKSAIGLDCSFVGVFGVGSSTGIKLDNLTGDIFVDFGQLTMTGNDCVGIRAFGTIENAFFGVVKGELEGERCLMIEHTAFSEVPVVYDFHLVEFTNIDQELIHFDPAANSIETIVNIFAAQPGVGATITGTKIASVLGGDLVISGDILFADIFATVINGGRLTVKSHVIVGDSTFGDTSVGVYKPISLYQGNINVQDTAIFFGDIEIFLGDLTVDAGAESICNVGRMVGDLNVEGTLSCQINEHVGAITGSGIINGIINGVPFGNWRQKNKDFVVLTASDFTTQNPSPAVADNPKQVTFGPAQFGPTDPVQLDVDGAVTCNETDQYTLGVVLQPGREGASGSFALMFFQILIDGVAFGENRHSKFDNPSSAFAVQLTESLNFIEGQVLTVDFWRDGSGFNAGSLMSETPTRAGQSSSPSATIVLKRNRLVQPEIE